jgi:hypothetical protein
MECPLEGACEGGNFTGEQLCVKGYSVSDCVTVCVVVFITNVPVIQVFNYGADLSWTTDFPGGDVCRVCRRLLLRPRSMQ